MGQIAARRGRGEFFSTSAEETIGLGEALGRVLGPTDVLVLTGDLGAGKTQLTKGVARGMGVTDDVTSPTFTIEMVYEGSRMPLYHFDLYRLDSADQLEDTGLFDVLDADGPCLIEWGEQFSREIGDDRVDVFVSRLDGEVAPGQEPPRSIRLVPRNARGEELLDRLDAELGN
ncbi:MAG: tRNA (adenosine(37)-N6)-threonylcarbamoyltransferase complex ATPase subunit type 1 TsaE [Parafannyhessea sp.]|uniref:tRNA (adenosine(37)-N6)-threonylcarbamoyltransferase complex ATPase subunit type 1 TsaE n=1 Tax=Parafannyhessea sp. TaxID=2847324 RepID=UPI003F017F5D